MTITLDPTTNILLPLSKPLPQAKCSRKFLFPVWDVSSSSWLICRNEVTDTPQPPLTKPFTSLSYPHFLPCNLVLSIHWFIQVFVYSFDKCSLSTYQRAGIMVVSSCYKRDCWLSELTSQHRQGTRKCYDRQI